MPLPSTNPLNSTKMTIKRNACTVISVPSNFFPIIPLHAFLEIAWHTVKMGVRAGHLGSGTSGTKMRQQELFRKVYFVFFVEL